MTNPLVGRTFHFTWTSGPPTPQIYEMTFVSDTEKTSINITGMDYESTDSYTLMDVAPDIYMLSWLVPNGFSMTIVINFQANRILGYYAEPASEMSLQGTITEIKA